VKRKVSKLTYFLNGVKYGENFWTGVGDRTGARGLAPQQKLKCCEVMHEF